MALALYAAIALLALWMAYSFVLTAQLVLVHPVPLTIAVATGLIYLSFRRR